MKLNLGQLQERFEHLQKQHSSCKVLAVGPAECVLRSNRELRTGTHMCTLLTATLVPRMAGHADA